MAKARPNKSCVQAIEGFVMSTGGVISPPPAALIICVSPWRELGGPVQRRQRRIEVPMAKSAISRAMETWDQQVVRVEVECSRKATGNLLERNVARSRLRRAKPSPELAAESARLREPRYVTSKLGRFELVREFNWFQCVRQKVGARHEITVDVAHPDEAAVVAKAIARAERLVLGVERSMPAIRRAITRELLGLYNGEWRGSAKATSAAGFQRRLKLSWVGIGRGRVTVHLDADGMFTDHVVEVRLSPQLKIQEILLAG